MKTINRRNMRMGNGSRGRKQEKKGEHEYKAVFNQFCCCL